MASFIDSHFTYAEILGIKYLKLTNLFYISIDSQHDLCINQLSYELLSKDLMKMLQKNLFVEKLSDQQILQKNVICYQVTFSLVHKYAKC